MEKFGCFIITCAVKTKEAMLSGNVASCSSVQSFNKIQYILSVYSVCFMTFQTDLPVQSLSFFHFLNLVLKFKCLEKI
jgi:hypothetical protein